MATRVKGINSKAWFYGFQESLKKRPEAIRTVLAGSAAEQWLNGELFRHIVSVLPATHTAYPEFGKKDLTILPVKDGVPVVSDLRAATVIEVKVVYLAYSHSKRVQYVERLLDQVEHAATTHGQALGWVVGVYGYWGQPYRDESFVAFRKDLNGIVRDTAEGRPPGIRVAKPAMETLIDVGTVRIGGATAQVGAVAQYLSAGRSAPASSRSPGAARHRTRG
jgi:hypothetical protein